MLNKSYHTCTNGQTLEVMQIKVINLVQSFVSMLNKTDQTCTNLDAEENIKANGTDIEQKMIMDIEKLASK